jgi:hypothetical protein
MMRRICSPPCRRAFDGVASAWLAARSTLGCLYGGRTFEGLPSNARAAYKGEGGQRLGGKGYPGPR